MVHSNALKDDDDNPMGVVLVFDDLTELEKAQRIAAWREVARRIAHEVKNPLTPISLSAQRLKRRYSKKINDPVFDECTVTIIDHVELIRNLVNAFSSFAKFPTATPVLSDIVAIIKDTIVLYREGLQDIEFVLIYDEDVPELYLDRQQMKQALINLIDNAVEAINKDGKINLSVTFEKDKNIVLFEISDTGNGIPPETRARLFEPYYSTKTSGTGLGLAIVNSIVADHNAVIQVFDNEPSGARFVIEFKVPEKK
jgi:two-component system nitrogen regulation sensor histidine kinase NtrY